MIRRLWTAFLPAVLAAATPDFARDVEPLLRQHCFQCHGESVKMGELDLRTPESIRKGGTKGTAIADGHASKSLLYARIADKSMPLGPKKLSEREARVIAEWIDGGASGSASTGKGTGKSTRHWAFVAPSRPAVPSPKKSGWARTTIDAFLLARMEASGVAPVAPASKEAWLRRVHLGLIGLPPSVAEQRAFLADDSPEAFDRVVEDLLSRPQYGERWARRWLDVVRYGESNGYERDGTKPNVWRYRDWVIDAFNRDKPYDRFVTEQLAGDEIEGSNAETQIATTFLRLGTWDDEPAEELQDRYDQLDDIISATSSAFLGVTLRCARCHDHKFEPFSQKDYYRTLAVFQPLKRPQRGRAEFDRLVGTHDEIAAYEADKKKADEAAAEIDRKIERVRQDVLKRLLKERERNKVESDLSFLDHVETVLAFSQPVDRRNKQQKELVEKFEKRLDAVLLREASEEDRKSILAWRSEKDAVNKARMPEPPRAYIWMEDPSEVPPAKLLTRGDPRRPADELPPGIPAILGSIDPSAIKAGSKSSGRRLWLARWLTRHDNPLTARVMVNRIWQSHFGEGLVASENDFGVMGQRPSNPELLDWLATEFVQAGWSVKHLQRLITKSAAYRLSSEWNEGSGKADPENAMRWRWSPRRLEAEVLRDSTLAVSGRLNPKTHGKSVYPKLAEAVLAGQSRPGDGWGKSDEAEASRRSVYIFVKRSLAVPELEVLDTPDTTSSCEQRPVSTTGPQALIFFNGEFTHAQARNLAARLSKEAGPDTRERIELAYRLTVGRVPSAAEIENARQFLADNAKQIAGEGGADADKRALEGFALVLLNSNEYFYWM